MNLDSKQIIALSKLCNPPLSLVEMIIPIIIIFMALCFTIVYLIKIDLSTSNLDWEKNKCIPKYLFVSGFIQKEKGLGALASTQKNFKRCITDYINNNTLNPYVAPPTLNKPNDKNKGRRTGV
jgi:hypothetical protein